MKNEMIFPGDDLMNDLYHRLVEKFGEFPEVPPFNTEFYFEHLCESIIGQQLSEKVAPKIIERVRGLFPNGKFEIESMIAISQEELRAAGVSNAKAQYMKNIAEAFRDGSVKYEQFHEMSDDEIVNDLIQVKGIGKWTAEMFLIFTLRRPDVFSIGDYALRRGTIRLHSLPDDSKNLDLIKISERWAPNRSLASRLLWKSLEL